ncbi:MAG: DUF4981 domain-containing protein [Clostridiales bacterium]|nr:DUF4981 domain-containing protein [Clostridiales bacterium]
MKRKLLCIAMTTAIIFGAMSAAPLAAPAASPFGGEEWYDGISTVQVNREPAHSFFVAYQDAQTALDNEHSALTRDFSRSSYYRLLNGEWDFKWVARPADRIENFADPALDVSDWDKIPVPRSWQTMRNADGSLKYDTPIYSNQRYPWRNYEGLDLPSSNTSTAQVYAPLVYNPVGHYRRTFDLPQDWDGREVFVSFQGVESCLYLWINGEYVGYATDSFTASDFNITKYLKPGENLIAAQVYRWSIGSYVENQDMIRVSGIFRDVFLYSKNKVELNDFFVRTTLATPGSYDDYRLELDATVRNHGAAAGAYRVEATLKNMDGSDVWADGPLAISADVAAAGASPSIATASGSKAVASPRKWFADTPELYKLLIELKDPAGNVVETAVQRVGFRVIERNSYASNRSTMQINGKDISLRGTNRHEFSSDYGHALPFEDIVSDLMLMKQHNINAIRMSHYPNNVVTYDLADELGIYICDEANIESHEGSTGGKPIPSRVTPGMDWTNSVLDRGTSMVERDKNHASVVIWSYGNEATYTTYTLDSNYTFYTLSNWIKARDPGRLRKYERDNRDGFVDITSNQYPGSGSIPGYNSNSMPYIASEYEHAMGNSPGSLVEFWDTFRSQSFRTVQGGFLWDFCDQSVWMPTEPLPSKYTVTSSKPVIETSVREGVIAEGAGRDGGNALKGGYLSYDVSPELNANSNKMTIEAWVLPKNIAGNTEIVSKGESGFALKYNSSNNIEFFVNGYSAGTISAAPPADWLDGEWKLLTAVYDGSLAREQRYRLYINGEHHAYGSRSSSVAADNNVGLGLTVGNSPSYPTRLFPGLIGSVRIYRAALTQAQIQDAARGAGDPDVVYWNDFDTIASEPSSVIVDEDTYFAYGGDWGETVHDGSFSGNGMTFADRTPKPYMTEVKYALQEVWYKADAAQLRAGQVEICNEFLNTSLGEYDHEWEILKDGMPFASGSLSLSAAPLASEIVAIPAVASLVPEPGAEYLLNLRAKLKADEPWASAGYAFATGQFALPIGIADESALPLDKLPEFASLEATDSMIVAKGADFSISFDLAKAEITSIAKGGKELIASGPVISHWRSPGDNDTGYNGSLKDTWGNATIGGVSSEIDPSGKLVTIAVQSSLSGGSSNATTYKIYSNGEIVVTNKLTPSSSGGNLLKVGMSMKLAEGIDSIEYYGRGPVENYSDRSGGSHAGIYRAKTQDQYVPYLRPQFFGNRTDVRWYSVTDGEGNGLLIDGEELLNASASNYDDLDFDGLKHMYMSPKLTTPMLNIDMAQAPLGSAACGPGPLDKYIHHPTKDYVYTYRITPIAAADTASKIEASKRPYAGGAGDPETKVSLAWQNGFRTARFTVVNKSQSGVLDANCIVAFYDKDAALYDMTSRAVSVGAGEDLSFTAVLPAGADPDAFVKAYIWDAKTYAPLCEAAETEPDWSALDAAMGRAGNLDGYTRLSADPAYAALDAATALRNGRRPSQASIAAAAAALDAAIGNLAVPPLELFTKLSGTVYGNGPAYSAGNEYDKVFDGSTSTFFDHSTGSTGYAGIDLGAGNESQVHLIRAYPRSGRIDRFNGSTFRGSMTIGTGGNTGALLHTISGASAYAWHQWVPSNIADEFRYLWFMSGPDSFGNVSEVEFYVKTGADRSLLDDRMAYAKSLAASEYTPESWSALQSALGGAEGLATAAPQGEVDSAASALKAALAGLASN